MKFKSWFGTLASPDVLRTIFYTCVVITASVLVVVETMLGVK